MALLDTPQAMMYGNMTSQYQLIQHPYGRASGYPAAYTRDYEQEAAIAAARFNIHQRLQPAAVSPDYHQRLHSGLKEEISPSANSAPITVLHNSGSNNSNTTAFRPYSSPGQENLPQHHITSSTTTASLQAKVLVTKRTDFRQQVFE
jgi:hypothetical protein